MTGGIPQSVPPPLVKNLGETPSLPPPASSILKSRPPLRTRKTVRLTIGGAGINQNCRIENALIFSNLYFFPRLPPLHLRAWVECFKVFLTRPPSSERGFSKRICELVIREIVLAIFFGGLVLTPLWYSVYIV